MLRLLHRTSGFSAIPRPYLRIHLSAATRRSISVTSTRWSSSAPEPPTPEEEAELQRANSESVLEENSEGLLKEKQNEIEDEPKGRASQPQSYNQFLSNIGAKYKFAKSNNWLGGDVPFPMNPTFKPPSPLPDALRQQIYNEFMADPTQNSVRILSHRYHLSIKRVDAILRLKGLEHSWYKNKQIQYGFQRGMEKLLGVNSNLAKQPLRDGPRWDATEADSLEQDENRDAQRQRYQRHYWESVPEDGREPIVPTALEHAKNTARRLVMFEERLKSSNPRLMPRFPDGKYIRSPPKSDHILHKNGRPTLKIRDVGGKFLDLDNSLKRIAVTERRARERGKKRNAGSLTVRS